MVRNIYYPIAGFVSSFIIILLLGKYAKLSRPYRWMAILISCVLLAILCTVAVNPITFMQQGVLLSEMTAREIFAGYFNYTLIYLLWGVGYLHIDHSIFPKNDQKNSNDNRRIMLEKNNILIPVEITNITHIKAAGDFVEVFTDDSHYLNRSTLSSFVKELSNDDFVKSHRSIVVNINYVKALNPETKGEFQVLLKNNISLKASRTYASSLKNRLLVN
ncbi:MAG: LytTR family DNA-binding domain-containing protein [Emcibacteraceae bacterium]|nr:LytTR family DNA-binding domain-containing protein [Emcibacteraceae bacterium]